MEVLCTTTHPAPSNAANGSRPLGVSGVSTVATECSTWEGGGGVASTMASPPSEARAWTASGIGEIKKFATACGDAKVDMLARELELDGSLGDGP